MDTNIAVIKRASVSLSLYVLNNIYGTFKFYIMKKLSNTEAQLKKILTEFLFWIIYTILLNE